MFNIKRYSFLVLTLIVICISCSKMEGDYYNNYQNKNVSYDAGIIDYLKSQDGQYDSMLRLLTRVSLIDSLDTAKNITVFAFDNDAFNLGMTTLNQFRKTIGKSILSLDQLDSTGVDSLICRYVLLNRVPTDSLEGATGGRSYKIPRYPTYPMNAKLSKEDAQGYFEGGPQFITLYDTRLTLTSTLWYSYRTRAVNISATNGIVNIMAKGHQFGFTTISSVFNK